MASLHVGPELEFSDPVRQSLLRDIEALAQGEGGSDFTVPSDVWSALWLSDVEKLPELGHMSPFVLRRLLHSQNLQDEVLKRWNQRKRPRSTTSSSASSPPSSPRHVASPRQSRVSPIHEEVAVTIEGLESIPTSHPRPRRSGLQKNLSTSALPDSSTFWELLQLFWSDERIQQWKAAIFTENRTEACHNLITLAPHVHACWERALFALKPLDVAEDQKTMRVQFFWLRKYPRRQSQSITTRPELLASLDGNFADITFFSCTTEEEIPSGTILTLHTDDPETKPLPSVALLEVQWILHRLSALSGAADIFLSEFDRRGDCSDVSVDLHVSDESSLREGDWRWGDDSDGSPDFDIPAEKKRDVTDGGFPGGHWF